jgi:hypothetical protein
MVPATSIGNDCLTSHSPTPPFFLPPLKIYPGYNCCTHTDACKQGHDWDRVWERVQQLIVKSLISVQPVLRNNYRSVLPPDNDGFSCFEILG